MSVTAAAGFEAAGLASGIKPGGSPDLALVAVAPGPDGRRLAVPAAAVFTTNQAAAAPVRVSQAHMAATGGLVAAVVISSGNANAATGSRGRQDAERMCAMAGEALGVAAEEVLVCSTGLIGIPLPMAAITAGMPILVNALAAGPAPGDAAAWAILTTDTRPRQVVVRRGSLTVGGMAKGAAMLSPDMATMLAVLTTDASAGTVMLAQALTGAVQNSFNAISVDASCSTNDTVVIMASGAAGPQAPGLLAADLARACADLAGQMLADAEGATKVARVTVTGALDDQQAARAARRVAESQLVQCSLHGADPYWGRVVSELGSAGVVLDLDQVGVAYGGIAVCRQGMACEHDQAAVRAHMAGPEIDLSAELGAGEGRATVTTTDLSPAYIAENMRTS